MSTRTLYSAALAIALLLMTGAPVVGQVRTGTGGNDGATVAPAIPTPSTLAVSKAPAPQVMRGLESAAPIPVLPAVAGPGEDPGVRASSGLGTVLTAVGGGLIAGALVDFLAGRGRLGLDGAQAGAFGGGLVLATWGGLRLGAARGSGS